MASGKPQNKPFIVRPRALGLPRGLSYDSVEGLIQTLEGKFQK
jgi:hypothetical protein